MTLACHQTKIKGATVIETSSFCDQRGMFSRLFCDTELAEIIEKRQIKQINHSLTKTIGAIRGLHYQKPPDAEMKLIRCIRGRVWDVAVDLRPNSQTFLQWHAAELSANNKLMFVIPEGCAHGFQVLEENSELLYLHTASYAPENESGLRCDDPKLQIAWPLQRTELSEKDRNYKLLTPDFEGIKI